MGRRDPLAPPESRVPLALWALLLVAAVQRAWNAWAVPPLTGYDAPGHAAYILSILLDGRLPDPLQGWATFHPPLYYLLGAALWPLLSPLGPPAVTMGLRAIGSLAGIAAGWVTFRLIRRLGGSATSAFLATAVVLFIPCAVMAASMIGNEALAAGLAALALPSILTLQEDPRRPGAAALAGLFAGLALATKYTGIFVAAAVAVPFLRPGLGPLGRRSLALAGVVIVCFAGPIYARNIAMVGSLFPMTRVLEPVARAERTLTPRPRHVLDYFSFPADAIRRPSIYQVAGAPPDNRNRNRAMTSVWGLTYASLWYDPFGTRIPLDYHQDKVVAGPLLAGLGAVPTAVMLLGFLEAIRRLIRSRFRCADAPLTVMAVTGLVLYVAFTWRAPSLSAVKGSYLLPLAPAAGVFFARALDLLPKGARALVVVVTTAAVAASLAIFTCDVVFPGAFCGPGVVAEWQGYASQLPGTHLDDALTWFLGVP
jgi:4-amino-4-deoxy-L-arabinose transferase-like glycosyltransferase